MVGCYEKYCNKCVEEHSLENDPLYWKNNRWPDAFERVNIIAADKKRR